MLHVNILCGNIYYTSHKYTSGCIFVHRCRLHGSNGGNCPRSPILIQKYIHVYVFIFIQIRN